MVQDIRKRMDSMNRAIEASKSNVERVISAVNENYLSFISANITHHLHLRDAAEQAGDLTAVMHHQVMAEVYQSMRERMYYSGSPLQ